MNPADAAARGITDRSVVRLFTDRRSCLASITLTEDVRPGVVQLSTGAWYDPDPADPSFCRPRQPERAQRGPAKLRPVPGQHRPAHHGRDRARRRGVARGLGPPPAGDRDQGRQLGGRGSGRYSHDGVSLRLGSFGSGVASMLRAALFSLILIRLIALPSMPGWPLKACWSAVSICR